MGSRVVVLDTETTGLEPSQGHRIIEIGCVEIINRKITDNTYHQYIQPDRESDEGAFEVHGISTEFLADKPRFSEIAAEFIKYIEGAELIIHNAPFDVGFLDSELVRLGSDWGKIKDHSKITDSLVMARKKHPGQKNNLDILCKRYEVNNTHRELHGALLDAELLAEVFLRMTGGQETLALGSGADGSSSHVHISPIKRVDRNRPQINVIQATEDELKLHQAKLDVLGDACIWNKV